MPASQHPLRPTLLPPALSLCLNASSPRLVSLASRFGFDRANYLGLISREDIAEAFAVQMFVQRQKQARSASASA